MKGKVEERRGKVEGKKRGKNAGREKKINRTVEAEGKETEEEK